MPSDKKLNYIICHLFGFSTSLSHSLCTMRGPVCVMPCYKPMLAREAEGRAFNGSMILTRNDESEECHRLSYAWHSRSTWAVSATTEHNQRGNAARLFANGIICCQRTDLIDKPEHVVVR